MPLTPRELPLPRRPSGPGTESSLETRSQPAPRTTESQATGDHVGHVLTADARSTETKETVASRTGTQVPSRIWGQAGAVSASFSSSSALPTPPASPTPMGPVEQKPQSLPEGSGPARVPLALWPITRLQPWSLSTSFCKSVTIRLDVAEYMPLYPVYFSKYLLSTSSVPRTGRTAGSHQDFRSLQAKFQASQPETSELPKKPPKPEFNKLLKKFPPPELSEDPKKPLQPSCTDLPRKPSKPEPSEPSKKFPQLQVLQKALQPEPGNPAKPPPEPKSSAFPKKLQQPEPHEATPNPSQPDFGTLPKKPPQPEFSVYPRKPPQPQVDGLPKKSLPQPEIGEVPQTSPWKPESSEPHPYSSQPEFSTLPKKPPQPEFSVYPRKPPQPHAGGLPKKSLSQLEIREVPQTPPWKPESSEPHPHSSEPDFSTLPKKPPQLEFSVYPRKPPQPQVSGLPKKSLPQPKIGEVPQTPPWKPESSKPQPHSSQPDFNTFPKKIPAPQLNDLPKKLLHPDFGDLTRRSSEPEVSVFPKRPRQSEFKAPSKKPLQPELGSLPRVSSEPEFGLLPGKFLQPECQGPPRKFSQPESSALPKKHLHPEFFGDLPKKPPLPGSVSEGSLPTAVTGSRPRLPLSPGFGARQQRSGALTHSGGSRLGLKSSHPPRRRPLPPASSLGPPPAKPPLPPGPRDVQSFRRATAAATALRRTRSFAGIHFQAGQTEDILQDQDEVYELYEDMEPTDNSSPSPKGRDEVPSIQQPPRPPQDPELRKEKVPQPQQLPPTDPKTLKQMRKAEKAEREFRKKFKFEGEIVIQTRMMIDPNAKTRRGGGKHLGIRRGEILEVIEYTNKDEMLCRDTKGKYGYVPRTALLPLETEVYDDVGFLDPLESQPFPQER
ncbi:PML-RARA-regulated adapter molecule 1 isoform X2 [Ursus maritimus]|uniref:PML-RARA-regulated adapter molecule 1 n=1 Tax=Ursus maritimus TaxID=29073 RepID=A0A8M1FPS6_URSMA|nr:PML-RARA-regulated adapter molecule 1 isoform X2 [Ursus maritimus]